jgi:hypothetical protein
MLLVGVHLRALFAVPGSCQRQSKEFKRGVKLEVFGRYVKELARNFKTHSKLGKKVIVHRVTDRYNSYRPTLSPATRNFLEATLPLNKPKMSLNSLKKSA